MGLGWLMTAGYQLEKGETDLRGRSRARISQCMIVKNEEKDIERALAWGKGIVAEQIVVDTGSTDRTVEIAKQMGAKVYHFQWIDDFAAAKNFAIEKANYEWIVFLDADEYFLPDDARKLLYYVRSLHETKFQAMLTGRVNIDNQGNVMAINTQCRVFRNLPKLRYKRRIHEFIAFLDGRPIQMADAVEELSMYHTGYGEMESGKKSGRNLKLILEEIKENPDDFEMWGYLGQEYECTEDWDEADKAFRKALKLIPESERASYDVATSITALRLLEVQIHRPNPQESSILEAYDLAIKSWPQEADYDYIVGKYYASCGKFQEGERHLRKALELLEKYGTTAKAMILSGEIKRAYELLAVCCYNNKDMAGCVKFTSLLLKEDPYLMNTAMILIGAFYRDEETVGKGKAGAMEVAAFLGKSFYDFRSLKDRLFVLKASMAAGYQELIQVMREMFTPEELAAVDRALGRG